jgi:predicted ATPase
MYVKTVKIEDLRCFKKEELKFRFPGDDIDLQEDNSNPANINVILGVNGAGKTTILRAIAMTFLAQFPNSFNPENMVRKKDLTNDGAAKISFNLLPTEKSEIDFHQLQATIRRYSNGAEKLINSILPNEPVSSDLYPILENHPKTSFFMMAYGANRRLELGDFSLSDRQKQHRYFQIITLFSDEIILVPPQTLFKEAKNKEAVFDLLEQLLPNTIAFDRKKLAFGHQNTEIGALELADGYKSYLAWICDLLYYMDMVCPPDSKLQDLTGVVLLDEIDLHIHPSWQRNIVSHIAKALPKLQFVFTTHSPIIAGSISRQNLWVTRLLEGGSSSVEHPDTEIYGLNSDQILTSDIFGLESTRAEGFLDELETLEQKAAQGDNDAALALMRGLARGKAALEETETPVPDWVKEIAAHQKAKTI